MTTTPNISNNNPFLLPVKHAPGPKQGEWTYNDYARLQNDSRRYEIMNGVLIMTPAPSEPHQLAVVRFAYHLFPHVDLAGLGKLIVAPFDVELTPQRVVQPDVLVVLQANQFKPNSSRLGCPDLVIEVVSPGTASYDRLSKYEAYEQAGVSEYWLADPEEKCIEVLNLVEGRYQLLGIFQGQQTIPSHTIPGAATIAVELFFA